LTEGRMPHTTRLIKLTTLENNSSLVYCTLAVLSNSSSSFSGTKTFSKIPRTITVTGLCSTLAKRLPLGASAQTSHLAASCIALQKPFSRLYDLMLSELKSPHLDRAGAIALDPLPTKMRSHLNPLLLTTDHQQLKHQ